MIKNEKPRDIHLFFFDAAQNLSFVYRFFINFLSFSKETEEHELKLSENDEKW